MRWVREARRVGDVPIVTRSSEPKTKPGKIPKELEEKIVCLRRKTGRCTEALHLLLKQEGAVVPLSTIHRVLDRNHCLKKRSPYQRFHPHIDRPQALKSGDLVEIDTIHRMIDDKKRLYVFSLLDVYSRSAYARAYSKMNGRTSLKFVAEAERQAPFKFGMIQSDHGPEFSSWFVSRIEKDHRFTRLGKPNDNAHIERFNRTLQEECLDKIPTDVRKINCALKKYLQYYNNERIHLSINTTPSQVV
jgi:putative transposase